MEYWLEGTQYVATAQLENGYISHLTLFLMGGTLHCFTSGTICNVLMFSDILVTGYNNK